MKAEVSAVLPWNRREVYLGFSEREFAHVREMLSAAGIPCETRIVNARCSGTRGRLSSFGMNPAYENQFYVYVRKSDYERANAFLKKGA